MRFIRETDTPSKTSFLFYLFVSFVAFFPCLVLGQAYFDGDLFILFSIYRTFLKTALIQGTIPLWNPYVFAGQPFFADPNTMSAYPLLYPFLIFPIGLGFGLFYFSHLFWAMAGMHEWLKRLGLSQPACGVGALTFAFSGMFWAELAHTPVFTAFAWLPWFLGYLEKYFQTGSRWHAGLSGFTLAVIFLAGSPWLFVGVVGLGTAYGLFRTIEKKSPGNFSIFIFPFVWGVLPALLLAFPFIDFMRFSDRVVGVPDYLSYTGYSIRPSELYRLVFPIRPIDPAAWTPRPELDTFTTEALLGLWTPFLAFSAWRSKERWSLKGFLLSICLLSILVCFGKYFPLHPWLFQHIPGFQWLRGPFHFRFIYQIGACGLTAMGIETFLRKRHPSDIRQNFWPWLIGYMVLVLLGSYFFDWDEKKILLLFVSTGVGLGLYAGKDSTQRSGLWLFTLSLIMLLMWEGWSFSSSRWGPVSNLDFKKEAPLFAALHHETGDRRFFLGDHIPCPVQVGGRSFEPDLPANVSSVFQMKNAGGSNALSLAARGDLFTTSFQTFQRLMAIQAFATGNERGDVPGFIRKSLGPVNLYTAKEFHPMVYAPRHWSVVTDSNQRLIQMRNKGFNPYEISIVDETSLRQEAGKSPSSLKSSTLVQETVDRQEYQIRLTTPGLVVFSEANFPGWRAFQDGVAIPIYTTNHLYRGAFLSQGKHQISFKFDPICVRLSLFVILSWLASSLLLGLFRFRSKNP